MDQKGIKLQMKKICDFVGNFMRSLVVKGLTSQFTEIPLIVTLNNQFTILPYFLTRRDRAFILHMCIPCDKTFHTVP